jgi:hypothetical protein
MCKGYRYIAFVYANLLPHERTYMLMNLKQLIKNMREWADDLESFAKEKPPTDAVESCKCHCHIEERTGIKCRCLKNCVHCQP